MSQIPTGYKQTDIGVIPSDWEVLLLDEVCNIIDPHPSHRAPEAQKIGIPFLGIGDLDTQGNIIGRKPRTVSESIYDEHKARYNLNNNLIGLGRVASIGKVVKLRNDIGKYTISPTLGVIDCLEIDHSFLFFLLQSNWTKNYFSKIMSGSTRSSVGMIVLRRIPIIHPPLKEQKAIATALSDIDTCISKLDTLITKQQQIKKGTMQQLLTGKKRLPGFDGEWEEVELGSIASFYKGKGLPKSAITISGDIECVHYGELFTKYGEVIEQVRNKTNHFEGCFLSKKNDVLMPTSDVTPNGLATASCIQKDSILLGGDILVIRIDRKVVYGGFLSYYIKQNKPRVMELVTGTTVYHLYGSDMARFIIKIPQIEEQEQIVQILTDIDTHIHNLQTKKKKYEKIKLGMMQKLLTGQIRLV